MHPTSANDNGRRMMRLIRCAELNEVADGPAHEPGFLAFAQTHLIASDADTLDIATAYELYRNYSLLRGDSRMAREVFVEALHELARRCGGGRNGERLTRIALRFPFDLSKGVL